jgi:hypothetical protein
VEVEVTNPKLVDELAEALRRFEFTVARTGPASLTVRLDPTPPGVAEIEGAAELELDLYLKGWEATHPGVRVARVAARRPPRP